MPNNTSWCAMKVCNIPLHHSFVPFKVTESWEPYQRDRASFVSFASFVSSSFAVPAVLLGAARALEWLLATVSRAKKGAINCLSRSHRGATKGCSSMHPNCWSLPWGRTGVRNWCPRWQGARNGWSSLAETGSWMRRCRCRKSCCWIWRGWKIWASSIVDIYAKVKISLFVMMSCNGKDAMY